MNISFISPSVSRKAGGIYEIERRLSQTLTAFPDTKVEIYSYFDEFTELDKSEWLPLEPKLFKIVGPKSFGYSPQLKKAIIQSETDIAHLHALWMYTSIVVHNWSKQTGKPYLTTLNGMIDPWAIKNSWWKKWFALLLYERANLNHSRCIQVNSQSELQAARAFGLKNPACIIPNGIDCPQFNESNIKTVNSEIRELKEKGMNVLLYLGRVHPKKGISILVKAWSAVAGKQKDWVLVIAGWDQCNYKTKLKQQVKNAGIDEHVRFTGPLFHEQKMAAYFYCDAFILPSFSEGLPMTVLESWSYGKPVVMTPACNLTEGFEVGAAIRIDHNVDSIIDGLSLLLEMTNSERQAMGGKGRNLVTNKFTWQIVAQQINSVYKWILGGGTPPDCMDFK